MLSEQLLETIRRIVTPLGAEERLAVIQAIATMPATEPIEAGSEVPTGEPDE